MDIVIIWQTSSNELLAKKDAQAQHSDNNFFSDKRPQCCTHLLDEVRVSSRSDTALSSIT